MFFMKFLLVQMMYFILICFLWGCSSFVVVKAYKMILFDIDVCVYQASITVVFFNLFFTRSQPLKSQYMDRPHPISNLQLIQFRLQKVSISALPPAHFVRVLQSFLTYLCITSMMKASIYKQGWVYLMLCVGSSPTMYQV